MRPTPIGMGVTSQAFDVEGVCSDLRGSRAGADSQLSLNRPPLSRIALRVFIKPEFVQESAAKAHMRQNESGSGSTSIAVFAAAILLASAIPGTAANRVENVGSDEIVIVVPVQVVGFDQEVIDNWVKDIGRYWQREDGQPFLSCGRKISFALEARARIDPDAPSLPGHHRLNVVEVPEGGVYHSNVQWLSADKDVTEDEGEGSRTSTAGKGDQAGVAAHLFGHWLGLPDEFCPDPTGDGTIVCSKAGPVCQRRFEDADTSLMARDPAMGRTSSGKVLQRHAERATELHHLFDDEICIEAVHTVIEQDIADAGSCEYIWDASTRLELSGRADSEGRVRGIGYITSQAKERSQGDCNAEGAGELLDEFAWTGTLRGQFINIELPAGMSYEVKITETVAGHKLDLSEEHTPPYRLKLVGHLSEASGRFKREWTERPTAEKTVDYELRIRRSSPDGYVPPATQANLCR